MRQGPRRGSPDNGADAARDFCHVPFAATYNAKLHPNGRAGVIFVLDFGLGERSVVDDAPVHGLTAAVDVTFFHEIEKGAGNGGLVFMAHGQVGIVPLAKDTETLEVFFVLFNVAQSELPAELAKFSGRYLALSA